jgi:hypothetical protein
VGCIFNYTGLIIIRGISCIEEFAGQCVYTECIKKILKAGNRNHQVPTADFLNDFFLFPFLHFDYLKINQTE